MSRAEARLFQQRALRQWRDSSWLATHDPRAWTALDARDPDEVCVDLSGGASDATQAPGYIVIAGVPAASPEAVPDDQRRRPDVYWNFLDGLPFEARVVDRYCLHRTLATWPAAAVARLPAELARTLVTGGTVELDEDRAMIRRLAGALVEHGFARDDRDGRFVLTHQRQPLADVAPHLIDERVLGEPVIRQPRAPVPA